MLIDLAPPQCDYEFTCEVVECLVAAPLPPFSESESLFMFLGQYEHDPDWAMQFVVDQLKGKAAVAKTVKVAALHLQTFQPEPEASALVQLLIQDDDAEVKRLADAIRDKRYNDPYTRDLGEGLDYTGALYRAIFLDTRILGTCECPSEPHGSDEEMAWARVFLAIHPDQFPTERGAQLKHPRLEPWLARFRNPLTPLQAGQAAVVIWRLTAPKAASEADLEAH
ncbi:MAG: hypothetical protein ABI743_09975 [bacterium]